MFTKYARAIDDASERRSMRGLYIAYWVFIALSAFSIVITVAAVSAFGEIIADEGGLQALDNAMILLIPIAAQIIGTAGLCLIAATLIIVFAAKFNSICKRPQTPNETPEVYAYRTELAAYRKSANKKTLWARIVFVLTIAACVTFASFDLLYNDCIGLYAALGISLLFIGMLAYFLATYLFALADGANGNGFAVRTEKYTAVIDELQNRPHKPATANQNVSGNKYLFPNENLREQIKRLARTVSTASFCSAVSVIAITAITAVFDRYVFQSGYHGYYVPSGLALMTTVFAIISLALSCKEKKIDEMQKDEMRAAGMTENLRLFDLHERYAKKTNLVMYAFFGSAAALGFIIAALAPAAFWSTAPIVLLPIWLFVNQYNANKLRAAAELIERDIAVKESTIKSTDTVKD